jgi:hypothetical protein
MVSGGVGQALMVKSNQQVQLTPLASVDNRAASQQPRLKPHQDIAAAPFGRNWQQLLHSARSQAHIRSRAQSGNGGAL